MLAADLQALRSPGDLKEVVRGVPDLVRRMIGEGARPRATGAAISDVADAVTLRLLELAEERLGAPPVAYAWLAAGSQGRRELTAGSDQDNAIVLADDFLEGRDGAYFRELSAFVCDGLHVCGYIHCPGLMMASTDRWRQPLAVWHEYFRGWIEQPQPKALMLSSVFFDCRAIHDPMRLYDHLHARILEMTKRNSIFLSYLAHSAEVRQPPIGFLGRFLLSRGGEFPGTLDLKINGVAPIVEVARVHALSVGLSAVNTFERLEELAVLGPISPRGSADLIDALDFIGTLRLRHQLQMAQEGRRPNNHVRPADLSVEERKHLRAAFKAVKLMQSAMAGRYGHGYF